MSRNTEHGYLYEAELDIDSPFAVPRVEVRAEATAILLNVGFTWPTTGMTAVAVGSRENYRYGALDNAAGKYRLTVLLPKRDPAKIAVILNDNKPIIQRTFNLA